MSSRVLVLVVDEDPQAAKLVTSLFASRGYDIRTASDAESTMSSVRAWRPALIICNLEMPSVDGIELCRRIRQTSNVAIIVVSGNNDVRSEVAALNAGADDYIVKPFNSENLLARARVALRRNKNALYMAIRDNGKGFDLYEALKCASGGDSLGLLGMKERAVLAGGHVEIETAPGTGTTVRPYFPMDPNTPYVERRARRRNTQ